MKAIGQRRPAAQAERWGPSHGGWDSCFGDQRSSIHACKCRISYALTAFAFLWAELTRLILPDGRRLQSG